MAYNFFPTGYPSYNVIPTQNNAVPTQMNVGANNANAQNALIWVNGEVGAKSYLVAPNSTVVLWDTESQTVYIKSADASGMPSIKTLDYVMRESAAKTPEISDMSDFATKEDISLIRKEIDALKEDLKPKKTKVSER